MNHLTKPSLDRRQALRFLSASAVATVLSHPTDQLAADDAVPSLDGVVGITTGGGLGRKQESGELNLLTVAKYVHDELGMRLIDVNSRWTKPCSKKQIHQAREAAESVGCFFSNLKVNDNVGDLYSTDVEEQNRAMSAARDYIEVAKILGTRWIRYVIPQPHAANPWAHVGLAEEAAKQGIKLLIENNGWMKGHPDSIASIVKAMGVNAAACPDTGNWEDELREVALRRSFVNAASCDFKVFQLGPNRQHIEYDLKQCFDIGWTAGFRGPWVIEHMSEDRLGFAKDTVLIREMLEKWIADSQT